MIKITPKQFITILCIAFLFCACGRVSEDVLYKVTIERPAESDLEDIYLSEIADSVCYTAFSYEIPLKLSQSLRYSTIVTDSAIVLHIYGEALKLYDFDGGFNRLIGNVGKGPGEYIDESLVINKDATKVYLHPHAVRPNSLSIYDLSGSNPHMIEEFSNDTVFYFQTSLISTVGDNILVYYSTIDFKGAPPRAELILYNPEANSIVDSLIDYHNLNNNKSYSIGIKGVDTESYSKYKDELYYMNAYSDTLYRVTENEISPFVVFDFGSSKFPVNILKSLSSGDIGEFVKTLDKSIILTGLFRTSDMLYTRFRYGEYDDIKYFTYALDLNDLTGRYCKGEFINDLDNGPNYHYNNGHPMIIDVASLKLDPEDDSEHSWVFPDNKMAKKMQDTDKFKRLYDKSTVDSNPIIQYVKLKE